MDDRKCYGTFLNGDYFESFSSARYVDGENLPIGVQSGLRERLATHHD